MASERDDFLLSFGIDSKKFSSGLGSAVGSAKQATSAISGAFTFHITGLVVDSLKNAARAIVNFGVDSVKTFAVYEQSLASLSAITGATGKDLQFFSDQAKEIGASTTIAAQEAVKAFELIGSAKPELLDNAQAMTDVTKAAITLAEAAGLELPEAALSLTDAMNQFGAGAEQANRFINVLAAGSKAGAAAVPQVTQALLKFGAVAKQSNISIEESVGLIETLAERGLKGAEAGTALRNVLLKLSTAQALPKEAIAQLDAAGVNTAILSDNTISLGRRLQELAKIQGNATAISKVFGAENAIAANVLLESTDRLKEFTSAVTNTNVAQEQAAIQTDTLAARLKQIGNIWENIKITVGGFLGTVLKNLIDFAADAFGPFIEVVQELFGAFGDLGDAISGGEQKMSTLQVVLKGLSANFKVLMAPMKFIIQGITFMVEGVTMLVEEFPALGTVIKALLSPLSLLGDAISFITDLFSDAEERTKTLGEAISFQLGGISGALGEFQSQTGATKEEIKAFSQTLDASRLINLSYAEAIQEIKTAWNDYRRALELAASEAGPAQGSLAALKAELDGLNKAFQEAATGAERQAIFVDVKRVQSEIEAIERLFRTTDKEAKPAAGSIKALKEELSKLQKQFEETGSAMRRAELSKEISNLKFQIEALRDPSKGLRKISIDAIGTKNAFSLLSKAVKNNNIDVDQSTRKWQVFDEIMRTFADDPPQTVTLFDDIIAAIKEANGEMVSFGDSIMSVVKDVFPQVKQAGIDALGALARGLGEAIANGEGFKDTLRSILADLASSVLQMVGFALLNASTTAQPWYVALALAAAGLSLLGLSGFIDAKQAQRDQQAPTSDSLATSGTTSAPDQQGLSSFAGSEEANQFDFSGSEFVMNVDGETFGGVIERINRKNKRRRGN